jgi:hypothetical protein
MNPIKKVIVLKVWNHWIIKCASTGDILHQIPINGSDGQLREFLAKRNFKLDRRDLFV